VSNWQLKEGHLSLKRKICALLAISHHRRDLCIIELELELIQTQMTQKPMLRAEVLSNPQISRIWCTRPRRKTTENLSVACHSVFFGAHLAQPMQLGCTADFERFWPILGPKFNRISCFLVSGFPLDIIKISGHSSKTV